MEKIVKRLFLGGTLLLALAVSLTAGTSYADDEQSSAQTKFKFTVPEYLALSNVTNVAITQANVGKVNEQNITADVVTNARYVVKIHADQESGYTPDLKGRSEENTTNIPAITAGQTVQGGVSGWGIKVSTEQVGEDEDGAITVVAGDYKGVTATEQTFYTGLSTGGETKKIDIPVGIGVSPSQKHDTYSTTVTLTLAKAQ